MKFRLFTLIALLTLVPAIAAAEETVVSETDEAIETANGTVVETDTYSTSYNSSSSSNSAAVGNFAIKIGPVGNIYVVDSNTQLDPGIGGFLAFDYRFHQHWSAEVGVMVTLQDGTGISAGDNNTLLLGIPTFDLKYYFLGESRWDPYVLMGVGFYALTEGSNNNGTTCVGIGANMGVGTDFYITERFSVGVTASFRAIALIESIGGNRNGNSLYPFSMNGNFAYHF